MRAVAVAGEGTVEEAVDAVRAQPSMEGRALVADVSTKEPYVYADGGRVASRSSTTARSARSCGGSPAPARP